MSNQLNNEIKSTTYNREVTGPCFEIIFQGTERKEF